MRFLMKSLLAGLLVFACGCSHKIAETTLDVESQNSQKVGAYGNYEKPTAEECDMFSQTWDEYDSKNVLTPLKVSRQVVSGMNYRFLCRSAEGKQYMVVIYVPLPNCGNPRVTSCEEIQ